MSRKHREIEERLARHGSGSPEPPEDLLSRLLQEVPEELPSLRRKGTDRRAPMRRWLQAAAVLVVAVGAGLLARQVEWRTPDPQAGETPVAENGLITPHEGDSEEGGTPEDLTAGKGAEIPSRMRVAGEERARQDDRREQIQVGRTKAEPTGREVGRNEAPPSPPAVETAPRDVVEVDALESEPRPPEVQVRPFYQSGEVGEPIPPEKFRLFPGRPETKEGPVAPPPPPAEIGTTSPRSRPSGPRRSVAGEPVEGSLERVRDQPLVEPPPVEAEEVAPAPVTPAPPAEVVLFNDAPTVFEEIEVTGEAPVVDISSAVTGMVTGRPAEPPPERPGETRDPDPAADDLMVETGADPLSTFGLDVDTGSWNLVRRHLAEGHLPPVRQVRVEGMLNALDYGDPAPTAGEGDFAITVQGAPSPFRPGRWLMRLGIRAREVTEDRPLALTFVVDTSGSMAGPDRLELVQSSLGGLLEGLGPEDTVGLVTYGSEARVVVPQPGEPAAVAAALGELVAGGSTNAEAGLRLAYGEARRVLRPGTFNRVILLSDGVANVGATTPEELLERVGEQARRGIELSTLGVGTGTYHDRLMEQLADRGDGRYAYLDGPEGARRVLAAELASFQTVARDARTQVEFHPATVERWRLLGYENRAIQDHRFRFDREDAGEIGSGHAVTVLYELELAPAVQPGEPLAVVHLRWWSAARERFVEIRRPVRKGQLADSWQGASPALRLAGVVAHFAEMLRGTRFSEPPAPGPGRRARSRFLEDLALELRRIEGPPVSPRAGGREPGEGEGPDERGGKLRELGWMLEVAARLMAVEEGERGVK